MAHKEAVPANQPDNHAHLRQGRRREVTLRYVTMQSIEKMEQLRDIMRGVPIFPKEIQLHAKSAPGILPIIIWTKEQMFDRSDEMRLTAEDAEKGIAIIFEFEGVYAKEIKGELVREPETKKYRFRLEFMTNGQVFVLEIPR